MHNDTPVVRLTKLPQKNRLGALDGELGRVNRMLLRRMQTRWADVDARFIVLLVASLHALRVWYYFDESPVDERRFHFGATVLSPSPPALVVSRRSVGVAGVDLY